MTDKNTFAIKQAGLKATQPRQLIYKVFCDHKDKHLSAEAVYQILMQAGHDVGLATIYRVLSQFEAAGLLARHHFDEDHAVYELAECEHHDHLICMDCGHVEEFVDTTIEAKQDSVAEALGFQCVDHALTLYARCMKGKACPRRHELPSKQV